MAGNPLVNIAIFLAFVVVTLVIVIRASAGTRPPSDYYTGGRSFTGARTASPSPATTCRPRRFLGIAGAIALYGYDGFLYSIGFLVAWLVALLLVAELLRNSGRFTMADVLAYRMQQRPVRTAAAISTLPCRSSTCWPRWPAPAAWSRCCSASPAETGKNLIIAVVGVLMIVYVLVGGMKGTTWVQIIKAVLLIAGAADHRPGARQVRLQLLRPARRRADNSRAGRPEFLEPGPKYGKTDTTKIDFSRSASRWCSAPRACRTS